jgi:uncharacterized membrane protein
MSDPGGSALTARNREVYIDVFRGLMALVMLQGHVSDSLLSPALQADPLYQFQRLFHGSTAPGFLFASGFVAGLPRSPLSARASLRRARRLLYVLGVGYFLHLPYLSFWKTLRASPGELAALFACDALQCIAVTQLAVLGLQWLAGVRWTAVAGALAVGVLAAGPFVWSARVSEGLPPFLRAYVDESTGSHFPLFPYAAFVLAGTVAGARLGRSEPQARHRRTLVAGLALLAAGILLHLPLRGQVDFWHISPGYALIRLGGLLLLLRVVEAVSSRGWPGVQPLALLGHETLQVFVLHLVLLYGGVLGASALLPHHGRLGYATTALILLGMLPVLYAAAWLWHRAKGAAPHEAQAALACLSAAFVWVFFTSPW